MSTYNMFSWRNKKNIKIFSLKTKTKKCMFGAMLNVHTSNLFVSISGGSTNLCKDSVNTKVPITTRNSPFIKPDSTSTLSKLKKKRYNKRPVLNSLSLLQNTISEMTAKILCFFGFFSHLKVN